MARPPKNRGGRGTGRRHSFGTDRRQQWFRSIYRAAENPRIRKSYLREMLRLHGESKFRREFNCEFVSNGASLINKEAIHDMFH
jgi:hypothetical protein